MIIQLESSRAEDVKAAWREPDNLADRWGQATTLAPATIAFGTIQPMAGIMILIPPAALTVRNPADRIRKRHRAKELIGGDWPHQQHEGGPGQAELPAHGEPPVRPSRSRRDLQPNLRHPQERGPVTLR